MRLLSLCLFVSLGIPGVALAQESGGLDAHGFVLTAQDGDVRDGWVLHRPGAMSGGAWFIGGALEYANKPLVLVTQHPDRDDVVDVALNHVTALNLSAGISPHERVRIAMATPLYLTSTGLDGGQGAGIGDMRLDVMASILSPADGALGLAVVPYLDLPLGSADKFLGKKKLGGGLLAATTYELDRATLTANLGAQFNPTVDVENLNGSDALIAGLGGNYLLDDDSSIGLETHFTVPFAKNDRRGTGSPAEALLSYRKATSTGGFFTGGLALPLSAGVGAASFRLIIGGGFGKVGPSGPGDSDLDGIANKEDACPNKPETKNNYLDEDGCPDELARISLIVQRDGQVVEGAKVVIEGPDGEQTIESTSEPWERDARPESMWRIKATKGDCLEGEAKTLVSKGKNKTVVELNFQASASMQVFVHDADNNPIPDAKLAWKSNNPDCLPEPPAIDRNGRGQQDIGPGMHRLVVGAPGYRVVEVPVFVDAGDSAPVEVTLKETKLRVEKKRIVILEKVQFESGRHVIMSRSFDLLNEVAEVIKRNPQAGGIEIQGHTDDQGAAEFNRKLSQQRADAVRKFLMNAGVAAERLVAVGYGMNVPIGDNKTDAGRAENRRVEFHFVDQSSNAIEETE